MREIKRVWPIFTHKLSTMSQLAQKADSASESRKISPFATRDLTCYMGLHHAPARPAVRNASFVRRGSWPWRWHYSFLLSPRNIEKILQLSWRIELRWYSQSSGWVDSKQWRDSIKHTQENVATAINAYSHDLSKHNLQAIKLSISSFCSCSCH